MAIAIATLVGLSVMVYGDPGPATLVVSTDAGEWIYPLSEDRTIAAEGKLGRTLIHIEGGAARIIDSPCPNKTCVAAAAIRRPGEWSACLPNGVFIRVEGSEGDDEVDAVVR